MSETALVPNPTAAIDPSTGQLAINQANPLARMAADILTAEAHNYDIDDPDQFMAYLRCTSTPPTKVINTDCQPFNLVHYYCKPVELVDSKTGEVNKRVLCIMEGDDGTLYSSTAPGIFRTLLTLGLRPGGNKRFNPPYKVMVSKVATKHPSPALMLTIVGPQKKGK